MFATLLAICVVSQPPVLCSQWVYDKTPEFKMLEKINEIRKLESPAVEAVVLSNSLSKIAREHADNIIRTGKFAHIIDGKTPQDRIRLAGLCESDTIVSENIGMVGGTILVDAHITNMFNAFKGSHSHYKNMVDPRWEWAGIAFAVDPENKKIIWVMMFANKLADPYRIIPFYLEK